MSRLASLHGPSSPSSSPVPPQRGSNSKGRSASTPSSPSQASESTFHRRLRTILLELRSSTRTWDDLVLVDGLKAARGLVDTRTELDNALAALPSGRQPRIRIVGPKLEIMEEKLSVLVAVLGKLDKLFKKIAALVDSSEALLIEASKSKGWVWVKEEPLWCTWTLNTFVENLPRLIPPYHRSLLTYQDLVATLRDPRLPFDASKEVIRCWAAQEELGGGEGIWHELDEIFEVEVEKWD